MQPIQKWRFVSTVYRIMRNYDNVQKDIFQSKRNRIISSYMCKSFHNTHQTRREHVPTALRVKKPTAEQFTSQYFVDMKQVNYIQQCYTFSSVNLN